MPRSSRCVAKLWRSECRLTALPDARSVGRLMEQAVELARRQMAVPVAPWEQPALLRRHALHRNGRPHLPPLPQQREHLRRQHDVAILAPLPLLDADDHLRAVDVAGSQPDDLARAQPAAIAEAQHDGS